MKITEFSEVIKTFSNIYNRIPEIEQNIVVDNDYYGGNYFNTPRKYDNLYNFIHNRTTINNNSNNKILINSAHFHVEDLKKYEYEEVVLDYGINEQSFLIYAINNGNLPINKKNIIIETYAYLDGGSKKIINSCNMDYKLSIGEIKCIFEENLSLDLKKIFSSNHGYIGLIYKIIEEDKQNELIMCYFDRKKEFFYYGGMGRGSIVPKINLVELDVNNYRELYVFNTLNFEIPMKQMKNIDIHILPNESCKIDYSIEYFHKGKKIKKCDKCFESAVVKVPQFKLNPANSIQFQGYVFDVLAKDNIKKYKKGDINHIDKQILSNLEDIKKNFEIKTIGTSSNFK